MSSAKPCTIMFKTDEPGSEPIFHDLANDPGRLECWILNHIRAGHTVTITDATDPEEIRRWEQRHGSTEDMK